jgi:hypothetical protein
MDTGLGGYPQQKEKRCEVRDVRYVVKNDP